MLKWQSHIQKSVKSIQKSVKSILMVFDHKKHSSRQKQGSDLMHKIDIATSLVMYFKR